jgi:hypothetical protein
MPESVAPPSPALPGDPDPLLVHAADSLLVVSLSLAGLRRRKNALPDHVGLIRALASMAGPGPDPGP